MKYAFCLIWLLSSLRILACGYCPEDGMSFYSLFKQTNISASEFHPFLRDAYHTFYKQESIHNGNKEPSNQKGNICLWNELLIDWGIEEIESALYSPTAFNWANKKSGLERAAKKYIDFAHLCSNAFSYRTKRNSWDYNEIINQGSISSVELLDQANLLLQKETNQQLITRYHYQIIRILHYSKNWSEAVRFFETKVENRILQNEIYYYIMDQVAGCYFSLEKYDKAAYLFTKVLNKSIDRKKSAFLSFNFCSVHNAQGKSFFQSEEDEKDLLLITSLRNFNDEISNINKFIALGKDDPRIELLFIRALNNLERKVWPKNIGLSNKSLPNIDNNKKQISLLRIAEKQANQANPKNQDFWRIASSYLSFINNDISKAENKLEKVSSLLEQKKTLEIVYKVFSWNKISLENENFISSLLQKNPINTTEELGSINDLDKIIQDKVAHTYYKNDKLAKAFLVHNNLESVVHVSSIELLNALEVFHNKKNKSKYEKSLLNKATNSDDFLNYINEQKGIYHLYNENPELALVHFNQNNRREDSNLIPKSIFSNNIKECFSCPEDEIMLDQVHEANAFSFIRNRFSKKELALNLIKLKKMATGQVIWKSKLANYLLANYYYNLSNTGYYRGILTNNRNCCDYNYIHYSVKNTKKPTIGSETIANKTGYNLSDIGNYEKHYFNLAKIAFEYYQKVIDLSTDKELNSRCFYLMAKCELNDYYNNGGKLTYKMKVNEYYQIELPLNESFKILNEKYADTDFYNMIIKECSYLRQYPDN